MDEILSIGGYDYISNPETGETSAVNPDTGEILPTVTLRMPANSQIISPKAAAAMADRIQRYKIYKENLERANQLGKFNFLSIDANFSALAPANVARLVYLSTYLPFNDSSLRFKNTRQLSNRNLPEVLGISKSQANRFLEDASRYVTVDNDGYLALDNNAFIFGSLKQNPNSSAFQKLYRNSFRKLYKATDVSKHKLLGYIFMMLPYISKEYNLLCSNIYETELWEIDTLSVSRFCRAIDYSEANAHRLIKEYESITFPVGNTQKQFCTFVSDGGNRADSLIYINPRILYNGSNAHLFELHSLFYKANSCYTYSQNCIVQ